MILARILAAYRQWRRYQETVAELSRLDNRELADLGISRADITRLAWETAAEA